MYGKYLLAQLLARRIQDDLAIVLLSHESILGQPSYRRPGGRHSNLARLGDLGHADGIAGLGNAIDRLQVVFIFGGQSNHTSIM